jgi:quercetin dioxygenase-like cupin family protein
VSPRVTKRPSDRWSRLSPGVRVRHLIDGEGTALQLYQLEAGTRFDLHAHPFPELGMVLSGTGIMVIEDEEQRTEAGDSFYLPGGMPHGFRVPEEGPPVLLLNVEAGVGSDVPRSYARELPRIAWEAGWSVGEKPPSHRPST